MPDYLLKHQVLNNGCVEQTNKLSKVDFLTSVYASTGDAKALERAQRLLDHIDYKRYDPSEVKEALRVINAHHHRTLRLKERISLYLDANVRASCGSAVFLTLTFTDAVLNSTTTATRRRYVSRFLKQHSNNYVANIDYGKLNHREHYHALILCDRINYTLWHQYGAINGEKVRLCDDTTSVKLSKYISKLTNHAIKETTCGCKMLYGRDGLKPIHNYELKAITLG